MSLRTIARFLLLPVAILGMSIASTIAADPPMAVQEVHQKLVVGDLILLDIRSPSEWQETGVAEGAWPVSMHDRQFGEKLGRILSTFPDRTIGLICAVGGRSGYVWEVLTSRGMNNFVDISEGMMGSDAGPGWLKAGLPVVSVEKAMEALPQYLRE